MLLFSHICILHEAIYKELQQGSLHEKVYSNLVFKYPNVSLNKYDDSFSVHITSLVVAKYGNEK